MPPRRSRQRSRRASARLAGAASSAAEAGENHPYGGLAGIEVTFEGDFVAIVAEPAVGFTADRALFLFRRLPSGGLAVAGRFTALEARRLFGEQAGPPLEEIGDLTATLEFSLGNGKSPFLLVAYYPLQQSSNWHALRWAVLAADGSGKILAQGEESLLVKGEPVFEAKATATGFTLAYTTDEGLDNGYWARDVRRRFAVRGEEVVEEGSGSGGPAWIRLRLGPGRSRPGRKLEQPGSDGLARAAARALDGTYTEYGRAWVDACPPRDRRWVIEVKIDTFEGGGKAPPYESLFLTVEPRGDDFRMLAAGTEKPRKEPCETLRAAPR